MVVTGLPTAALTGTWQDRTAAPPRCTVQAPQWPAPHPYLAPVSPRTSRSAQRSGMSGGAATRRRTPLIRSTMGGTAAPPIMPRARASAPRARSRSASGRPPCQLQVIHPVGHGDPGDAGILIQIENPHVLFLLLLRGLG